VQVYVNGHDWLARQMDQKGIGYTAVDCRDESAHR
jgi:hypothetical protein